VLSPGLSGLCLAIFTTLWGFTIIYGSYSRHSQRVVQVRGGTGHAAAGTVASAKAALQVARRLSAVQSSLLLVYCQCLAAVCA
jgi:hypothetical protein